MCVEEMEIEGAGGLGLEAISITSDAMLYLGGLPMLGACLKLWKHPEPRSEKKNCWTEGSRRRDDAHRDRLLLKNWVRG